MARLVRGGRLLSADGAHLERRDVLVDGDRITDVAPTLPRPAGAEEFDTSEFLAGPGYAADPRA